MNSIPLYWRTRYGGSLCERQAGPVNGWMTVRNLTNDTVKDWNVADLVAVSDAEAIAEARAMLG